MYILRLVTIFMLFTLLSGQSLFIPSPVNAWHCCPCNKPNGPGC